MNLKWKEEKERRSDRDLRGREEVVSDGHPTSHLRDCSSPLVPSDSGITT